MDEEPIKEEKTFLQKLRDKINKIIHKQAKKTEYKYSYYRTEYPYHYDYSSILSPNELREAFYKTGCTCDEFTKILRGE